MSRILRRPMFRGGSTSNEGIMSVPRKGYQGAGFVNEEELAANESLIPTSTPKQTEVSQETQNTYKAFGRNIEKGTIDDEIYQSYIGRRSDPASKFLINFGLKYMSARPRRGKFGLITTAADAAQKPTEELYADIDKERELKLKVMTALSKGEGAGSFEKKINFLDKMEDKREGGRKFTKQQITDAVRRDESEQKEESLGSRINKRAEKLETDNKAPSYEVAKSMATFQLDGINKIPKEHSEALDTKYFLPPNSLTKKPNSIDFSLTNAKNLESTIGKLKVGKTYVEPTSKTVYLYADQNTFRPLSKY